MPVEVSEIFRACAKKPAPPSTGRCRVRTELPRGAWNGAYRRLEGQASATRCEDGGLLHQPMRTNPPVPYDTGVAKRMPMPAATASDNAHPNTHTPIARAVLL